MRERSQKSAPPGRAVLAAGRDTCARQPNPGVQAGQHDKTTLPKINGICEAVFTKGSRKMQYREGSCTSELKEVDFLSPRFKLLDLGSSGQPKPRGIRPSKKDGILQLLNSSGVTPAKMRFWHDLVKNKAAADLVTNE